MKITIEQKIRFGIFLALGILLVIGGIGYFSAEHSIVTFRSVDHSHEVMDELDNISIGMLNAEAAARSFTFSGEESLVKTYLSGVSDVESGLTNLRQLTKDDPAQQHRVEALEPLINKKLEWIKGAIVERRAKGFEAASKKLGAAQSLDAMDQVRHLLAQIESEERRHLATRSAKAQKQARVLTGAVLFGSLAAMCLVGFAGIVVRRDFNRRRRAEEERDRFFNLSRDLLCIASFDGFFKSLNPVWEQVLGYSRHELQSSPFIEFVHPEDRPRTLVEAGKLTAGGEISFFENRYRRKDGTWRWLSWSARASLEARMIYATARDITEQRAAASQIVQLNAELQQHASQLEAANKELEAFSYSVSHDLRAPLRHIAGFVELLRKQTVSVIDATGTRYLSFIAGAVKQMGRLVDDLLNFSRMARSELRQRPLNLEHMVADVRREMRSDLEGRNIDWKIGTLPEVQADPAMLRLALTNLISNAVKYTRPREQARIEIGSLPSSTEHIAYIRDNGVGFDMQYSTKLFGVFQRLHSEDEFEGTGIGLANVRRIMLRHGGRVWADAKEGEGATFYFSLPKIPALLPPINAPINHSVENQSTKPEYSHGPSQSHTPG
jgi:PAS domain S-box-containing protein